jgi:hypothetical protein
MSTSNRSFSTMPPSKDEPSTPGELLSLRAQSAIVRTLADALAHHTGSGDAEDGLRQQLDEELDRLGSQLLEAASVR